MKFRQKLGYGALAVAVLGLGACGHQPQATRQTATRPAQQKVQRKAQPAKPRPKADQQEARADALPQGVNHNQAAAPYAHPASEVQRQMATPATAEHPRTVYLTFDDGPNNDNTPKVLDLLKQAGVHATFFVVGNQIGPNTAATLKRTYAEGHAIALHSTNHEYGFEQTGNAAATQSQIDGVLGPIRSVLGSGFKTGAWRYPGGHMSFAKTLQAPDRVLAQNGLSWIDWNAESGDALSGAQTPKTVAAMLAHHQQSLTDYGRANATVVLMHDSPGKDVTVAALPQIIDYYKQNGYAFGVIE